MSSCLLYHANQGSVCLFFLVRLSQHLVFDATQKHTTLDDL